MVTVGSYKEFGSSGRNVLSCYGLSSDTLPIDKSYLIDNLHLF